MDNKDLYEATIVISLDSKNNLKILKSRYGDLEHLDVHIATNLISKIVANSLFGCEENILKLFSVSVQNEVSEKINEIYKKYDIETYNYNMNEKINYNKTEKNNGTSLKGYLNLNYDEIASIFGNPNIVYDEPHQKIDWEWIFELDDRVFTIYNYKDGPNYTGEKIKPQDIECWHIGGNNKSDFDILEKFIYQKKRDIILPYPLIERA